MSHFKGKQFQQDVIIVAVGYYLRYNLSYREVQEIELFHTDRGKEFDNQTIQNLMNGLVIKFLSTVCMKKLDVC